MQCDIPGYSDKKVDDGDGSETKSGRYRSISRIAPASGRIINASPTWTWASYHDVDGIDQIIDMGQPGPWSCRAWRRRKSRRQ